MTRDDEVVQLRAENARLQAENGALRSALAAAQETIRQQQEALARLEARVAELEQKPPPWAKAQTPPRPPKERKKRAPEHNMGRRREGATQFVGDAHERRPHRAYAFGGRGGGRGAQGGENPEPGPGGIYAHPRRQRGWS